MPSLMIVILGRRGRPGIDLLVEARPKGKAAALDQKYKKDPAASMAAAEVIAEKGDGNFFGILSQNMAYLCQIEVWIKTDN